MANSSAATSDRAQKAPQPVILLGLGGVGRALLRQIEEQRPLLEREYDLRIAWLALSDSSGAIAPPEGGFSAELLAEILQLKEDGAALASHSLGRAYANPAALVEEVGRPGAVVVDCTASDETSDALFLALDRGYQVVLANKKPLTAAQDVYDRLNRIDIHVLLACLQYLLARTMPAHFGRGRIDPQQFTAQAEACSIRVLQYQAPGLLLQADGYRPHNDL